MQKLGISGLHIFLAVIILFVQIVFSSSEIYSKPNYKDKGAPLDEPNMSHSYAKTWAEFAVSNTMTFNFNNIDARLEKSSSYFTEKGWYEFSSAIKRSRILDLVKAHSKSLKAMPNDTSVLESSAVVDGHFQWVFRVPLTIDYSSGSTHYDSDTIVTVVVVRSNNPRHTYGIAIDEWDAESVFSDHVPF